MTVKNDSYIFWIYTSQGLTSESYCSAICIKDFNWDPLPRAPVKSLILNMVKKVHK